MQLRTTTSLLQDLPHPWFQPVHKLVGKGIAERGVCDDCTIEERDWADAFGAVDDLSGQREVTWGDLLSQRAYGGEGENSTDAEGFQGGDVGARRDERRVDVVSTTMSSKESDFGTGWQGTDVDRCTRVTPWLWKLS